VDFTGKICVVTGASSGLGKRLVADLAADGASVCAVARRSDRLEEIVAALPTSGTARHSYFTADVSDRDQVAALARHVDEMYGRCDVLVNNAGVSGGGAFVGEQSIPDLERVFKTNFFGAAYCTAALLSLLERSAPSHVVNVASIAGRVAFGNGSAYCGSKFALVGWSEALHYDLKKHGVFVSLVEPGPVPTEGFPQSGLIEHPILRNALAGADDVSRAVRGAIRGRKMQRVVPRYYYFAPLLRLLIPPVFRLAAKKLGAPNATGK
jgi:NAD(P)-dependent dehydrogenase (short-subunit alcohol dehydrogenase family)